MNQKTDGFKYDLFVGGPRTSRVDEPYRQMIFEAFSRLKIYDWETYKGDDYQQKNHEALADCSMLVAMIPAFSMPMVAEEIGYFYAKHQYRIEYLRRGLYLNHQSIRFGGGPPTKKEMNFVQKKSPPINPIILIWPKDVDPKTQKSYLQVADIVSTTEEAIALLRKNLAYIRNWKRNFYPHVEEQLGYNEFVHFMDRVTSCRDKDIFFNLVTENPRLLRSHIGFLLLAMSGKIKGPEILGSRINDVEVKKLAIKFAEVAMKANPLIFKRTKELPRLRLSIPHRKKIRLIRRSK